MIDHSHNVQICAGCMLTDIRLALSLIRDHNQTLGTSQGTYRAEQLIAEIVENIEDASFILSARQALRATEEAGLGTATGE